MDDDGDGDDDGADVEGCQTGVCAMGMQIIICLLYTSPSPRDGLLSRMPSSA